MKSNKTKPVNRIKNKTKTNKLRIDDPRVAKLKARRKSRVDTFLLAQIDPFDQRCAGAKCPDYNNMPSATNRFHTVGPLTTDANGICVAAFRWQPSRFQLQPSVTAGTANWTTASAFDIGSLASMTSLYSLVRCVGYGVKIRYIGSQLNSAGRLHIGVVGNNYFLDGDAKGYYPDTVAELEGSPFYANYSLNELARKDVAIPGRRMDEGSFRYRSTQFFPSNNASIQGGIEQSDGWSSIIVWIEGATANTTVCEVEFCYHYEGVLLPSTVNVLPVTPARPFDERAMVASSAIAATAPTSYQTVAGNNGMEDFLSTLVSGVGDVAKIANLVASFI